MMVHEDFFEQLIKDFGLPRLLEQNDLEEWQVLKILFMSGLLDFEDYVFTEMDVSDED